jgi:manganese oxidase
MSAYLVDPGTYLPKVAEMTDFNMWTWNCRVFPGIDPLAVRLGDRVRVRIGNLTMTNHPIHLHGHSFAVTCTDGGWVPESARWPEATTDVPVGTIRAIEMIADAPGDWAFHCHKSHHTMNAMSHNIRNFIGADLKSLTKAVQRTVPEFHPMGSDGMAAMATMEHPMPDNTLPMMTGFGQFGPIEMGGMFTLMKIREALGANDYGDPGPYGHPEGTVAHEIEAEPPVHHRSESTAPDGPREQPAHRPAGHLPGHITRQPRHDAFKSHP